MILVRGVPPAMLAALENESYPVLFAHLDWPEVPVWVHSAVGPITWGGQEWRGMGQLGHVDIPEEFAGIAANDATFSLGGVTADLDGYSEDQIRGRIVELYYGCLTDRAGGYDGKQPSFLVSDPVKMFTGLMDQMSIKDTAVSGKGVRHEVNVGVSTGVEARAGATVYHSDENQKRHYPGDTAGRLVILAYANALKLRWPAYD